jgi:preprotein translocase subunit SecB
MDEVSAKLNREVYWKHFSDVDELTREIGAIYKTINIEEDHFDVLAEYELRITHKKDKNSSLEVKCRYSAHFHASSNCNGETVERFANSEAKIIIWPYFRSLVSDITGRLHIPPITIPFALE